MEPVHPEVAKLGGGNRRSIGRSEEVVADVLADPTLFDLIFDAIANDDPLIRTRAADAVEKITARRPDLLRRHKRRLLTEFAAIPQQEVRWHVAQMLPRLSLSLSERRLTRDGTPAMRARGRRLLEMLEADERTRR